MADQEIIMPSGKEKLGLRIMAKTEITKMLKAVSQKMKIGAFNDEVLKASSN
jgi:hypothetical protein